MFEGACLLVGQAKQRWAVPSLIRAYQSTPRGRDWWSISAALAELEAIEAVPTMLAVIAADRGHDSTYGVAVFGLGRLLGVQYEERHDADWWLAWWRANASRLPGLDARLPNVRLSADSDSD
jgi:hypothetical protein